MDFFLGFGTNTSTSGGLFGASQQSSSTLFGNPGASTGNLLYLKFSKLDMQFSLYEDRFILMICMYKPFCQALVRQLPMEQL